MMSDKNIPLPEESTESSEPGECAETPEVRRIRTALHQVVLLRETGPKSAAWHRARVQTIWRLHAMLRERGIGNRG
jgi:hypothetical protein